jgi:hypothetical protein
MYAVLSRIAIELYHVTSAFQVFFFAPSIPKRAFPSLRESVLSGCNEKEEIIADIGLSPEDVNEEVV